MATQFKRISVFEARQRFTDGKPFYLCPCKMRPGFPWNVACLAFRDDEWKERAESCRDNSKLWKDTIDKTAWALMYANWTYYNTSHETGYYAHYYVEA